MVKMGYVSLDGTKVKASANKSKIEVEAAQRCHEYVDEKAEKKKEDDLWMEENGEKFERRPPVNPNGKSVAEIVPARRNLTDYDSRIMKEHQSGGHIQGYNRRDSSLRSG